MNNHPLTKKNRNNQDPYSWLRDKNWPNVEDQEVIAHLNQENDYFEKITASNKEQEKIIFEELKSRIKEEDVSYPIILKDYHYYSRMESKKDHPIFCRSKNEIEEIILDCNLLAQDKSSFSLGDMSKDFSLTKIAYSFDDDGSEQFKIKVRDINSKQDFIDEIEGTIGSIVWNKNGDGFFYAKLSENWRPTKIFFHLLGSKQENDRLIYEELDDSFFMDIEASASEELLLINSGNGSRNEIRFLRLDDKDFSINLAIEKKDGHLYEIEHIKNKYYILTNDSGKNFRLVTLKKGNDFRDDNFLEIIPHSESEYLTNITINNNYLVVSKKILGLNLFDYYSIENNKKIDQIKFTEEIYQATAYFTHKDDPYLRITYSSLVSPKTIYEFDFDSKELITRKVDEVLGYQASEYSCKRIWAKAKDGQNIPISLVLKKNIKGPSTLLLYGYGSYGAGMSASFRSNIISLLDRGFIYAIAHIRGGDELGFEWYEKAKFLNKKITFSDFISCAEHLIEQNYTKPDMLSIMGGSAGGMLMGVVLNERPELFKSAIALVPFVDVLNTMLDETLPLTPLEFEEWGNPKEKEFFEYMKSYCPYQNVKKQNYPRILATAGLTDPRVGYWEAAKWVAKLREYKTDNNDIILKIDMDSGHKGKSGRYEALEEIAMIYAFLCC